MAKKDRIYFKLGADGSLVPADPCAARKIKERNYKVGQILQAEIFRLRSNGLNDFAHRIGGLIAENIDEFSGMTYHEALKSLQIESRTACDEIGVYCDGVLCKYIIPRSFSFESMAEEEFNAAVAQISHYICEKYWPDQTPEEIVKMAEKWGRIL